MRPSQQILNVLGKAGTSAGVSEVVNYFDAFGCTQPFSFIATDPAAVYNPSTNKTWLGFEAWTGGPASANGKRQERVRVYNHTTKTWSLTYDTTMVGLTDDDHGTPALLHLSDNRVIAFGGAHSSQMQIRYTTNADDPSAWSSTTGLGGGAATGFTYPKPNLVGGVIYLFMRKFDSGTSNYYLSLFKTTAITAGVPTWAAEIVIGDLGVISGDTATSRFYAGTVMVRGTDIHIVATRATNLDTTRQNIYYFIYNTLDGSVRNFAGTTTVAAASLPIAGTLSNSDFKIYDTVADGNETNIPVMTVDASNNVLVAWLQGSASTNGPYSLVYIKSTNGTTWSAPATVGAFPTDGGLQSRYDGYCMVAQTNGDVDFYWQTQSPFGPFQRGGDISKRTLSSGVLGTAAVVQACTSTYALCNTNAVKNGIPEMQVIWCEIQGNLGGTSATEAGNLKSYAYGSNGFVTAPLYCSEALAFFARWSVAPSKSEKLGIDALIKNMIYGDIWRRIDVFRDYGLSDNTAATLNWKATTATATIDATATRTAGQGVAGNGAHYAADEGFNPSTFTSPNYVLANASFFGRSRTAAQSTGAIMGGRNTTLGPATVSFIIPRNASNQLTYRINDQTTNVAVTNNDGSGLYLATRNGTARKLFKGGVQQDASTQTATGNVNEDFAIGASGITSGSPNPAQMDIVGFGSDLSDVAATHNSVIVTYISAMGRT